MLRQLFVGEMKVPIPVPVRTLGEAVNWVRDTLLDQGSMVTGVELNQQEIPLDEEGCLIGDEYRPLKEKSVLKIQVDNPVALALESLDVVRELAFALQQSIPKVAVVCWQKRTAGIPDEFSRFCSDIDLMMQLLEHTHDLMDRAHMDLAPTCALSGLLARLVDDIKIKQAQQQWKDCAKILVDRLELWLHNLIQESEKLHIQLLAENPLKTKVHPKELRAT